jgi:invasion protein IalB
MRTRRGAPATVAELKGPIVIPVTRLFVLAVSLIPIAAGAQTSKEAAKEASKTPAVASTPERTTASFGDWVLRCEGAAPPAHRVCEVAQVITLQGQTSPTAQVALGKQAPNESKRLTVVLPPNIAITTKPQATVSEDTTPIELTWQRCTPGACFASAAMSDEAIGRLGAQTKPGRIVFKDAADREVVLPLSFRGLAQSLAALAKEQ